jgi:hypothetical protein
MLMKTSLNSILLAILLFLVVNNIVQTEQCSEQYLIDNQEQYGQQNIVQACFQQHCCRLGVFCSVESG